MQDFYPQKNIYTLIKISKDFAITVVSFVTAIAGRVKS